MTFSIDRLFTLNGYAIVTGWCSDANLVEALTILYDGEALPTITAPVVRHDVSAVHGPGAELWGFRACGMCPSQTVDATGFGLRLPGGEVVQRLTAHREGSYNAPHRLMDDFFDEVNRSGGSVLEIGSRGRSGNILRDRFSAHVRYVGLDVAAGENVDIVADAHHMSEVVTEKFDFCFSVSTFEHFLMPWKVALEINKVLKLGGKVMTHSHQSWPAHEEPWDYFRFSTDAWKGLFNSHTGFRLLDARRGEAVAVLSYFNPGGPFNNMENHPGYALSVSVAEKTANPLVSWDAKTSDVINIEYKY